VSRFSASRLGIALTPRKKAVRQGSHTSFSATRWGESTHAELAWDRSRSSAVRWGCAGALVGGLIAGVWFAPASWLASWLSSASGQQFMLTESRGTVWSGSAVAVLTGGPGSNDASALPGRLTWSVRPQASGVLVQLSHACCLNGTVPITLKPGWGHWSVALPMSPEWIGQWPSDWLAGLGTPWNTLQLGGTLRLRSSGLNLASTAGRSHLSGNASLELVGASSRLTTLDTLGSYRLALQGDPLNAADTTGSAKSNGAAQITLSTIEGALQLNGGGTWGTDGVRFQGLASARDADDAALTNLLNIIGRREGAASVITIGSP
jgi:general secretion pathway protein N